MRSEEFLAGMKNVDADLIEEAAPKSTGVSGKIARGVLKGVAAAALCAVVAGGVFLASRKYVAPPSAGTDAESTAAEQTEPAFKDIYDIPGALTKNSDCYQGYLPKNITYKPMTPEQYVESCKNNNAILVYGEIKNLKTITVNVDALDMYCEPIVNTWAIYTFDVEIEKNVLGECDKEVVRLIAANMIRESTDISTSLSYSSSYLSLQEGKKALFSIRRPDELTDQPFIIDIDPLEYADYYAKLQCKCDGETFIYSGWVENFALPLSVFSETEAAQNGGAVDPLDEIIKAVNSEKGMALKDFFRLVSPLYDHVTLESLSIENRKIIPPFNPSLNSNRPEIKTPISIMATSFYCNNSCCSVYSICDNGMPPFELPKEYIIDSLSGNAKPLQYDINDPVIQNSRVVAVRIYSTAYNRDFASCASQSIVSGKREPLSLEEAARTDKSEQLLLSDLILPENMEFFGSIEPRNRQTGDRYYNNGESWGCVIGTCADDGSNYDALMKTYNDLGSPVMTYALYTDTDINDPYKYDKRYAVTVMIPDSALEYVIRNLNSNKLQCDGEFVRELLKQTGTDLPVLSVSEILTDPYLFYDEDEMFAALNRPFMGYNAATGSAD